MATTKAAKTEKVSPVIVPGFDEMPGYLLVCDGERDQRLPKMRKVKQGAKLTPKPDQWYRWTSQRPDKPDYSTLILERYEKAFDFLLKVPHLESLDMHGPEAALDKLIERIEKMPTIRQVKLSSSPITEASLTRLVSKPSLLHLEINSNLYCPEGLRGIKNAANLKQLEIRFFQFSNRDLDEITQLDRLEKLYFYDVHNAPNETLDATCLSRLSMLKTFECGKSNILDSRAYKAISKIMTLGSLELHSQEAMTDHDLSPFMGHPSIEILLLGMNPNLTDKTIEIAANIPNLRYLSLYGCPNITDAGLMYLAKSTTLEKLSISTKKADAPYITAAGIEKFKQAIGREVAVG